MKYVPSGVCPTLIEFEIIDEKLHNVVFTNGCDGNLSGIARLVEGMPVQEVITRLEGTPCKKHESSCPDQLAQALKEALKDTLKE